MFKFMLDPVMGWLSKQPKSASQTPVKPLKTLSPRVEMHVRKAGKKKASPAPPKSS